MFGAKQSFAINISDFSLEALELVKAKEGLRIRSYSRLLLESGVVEDGKIIQADKLREAVQRLLKQAQPEPITAREVVLTLPESKVFVQLLSLPTSISSRQVPASLFSQAKEVLPVDMGLVAADYMEIGRQGDLADYLFTATYKNLVSEYVEFFDTLQLKVSAITMESLALGAAVVDTAADEAVLVLDIGSRTTIASVFRRGQLIESINIDIAGNNITAALAEKLQVSRSEAEERKKKSSLAAEVKDGQEMLIIQGQLQPLKDELTVFIKYIEDRTKKTIDRVLLAGGSSLLPGLDAYFEANLGLPTAVAKPLPEYVFEMQPSVIPKFLVVLGLAALALGERERTIDFLSRSEKDWVPAEKISLDKSATTAQTTVPETATRSARGRDKRSRGRTIGLAVVLILAAGGFAGIWYWKHGLPDLGFATAPASEPILENPAVDEPEVSITEVGSGSASFGFEFLVDVSGGSAGELTGVVETIEIAGAVIYDPSTITSRPGDPQSAALQVIAEQLWSERSKEYLDAAEAQGRYLLATPVDHSVIEYDLGDDAESPGVLATAQLTVRYRVLSLDSASDFASLEAGRTSLYLSQNPSATLQSREYVIRASGDGALMSVQAVYEYRASL